MRKTRGYIAGGHIATAEAAATMLREGGNAFDAAVAALLASFIAEPCMSSAGGGAFMTAFTDRGQALCYDFFVQTPRHKRRETEIEFFPVVLDFGTATEEFHIGMGSVGVPGSLAGIYAIHEDLCSLPMRVLAEPAIDLAKNGVIVDDFQYHDFCLLEPILRHTLPVEVFWRDDHLIKAGERMFMPEFADCLDHIVREGVDEFYKGEVAKMILRLNDEKGGHLQADDLAEFTVARRKPLVFPYRDRTVITNALPSLGGATMGIALGMLQALGEVDYEAGDPTHVERIIDVFARVAEVPRNAAELSKALRQWHGIGGQPPVPRSNKLGGTSHFSILDEHGNAVSISTSNGEACGHFVPGTGILMNNMLGESALLPNGLHSWEENVRLGSMMSPTLVLDREQRAEIVLGSGGAGRIPFMISQVLHYIIDHGMPVQEAVQAPRLHWIDGVCNLEPGLPTDVRYPDTMQNLLAWDKQSLYFGGVHAIMRRGREMEAEGDQRRGGVKLLVE